MDIWTRFSNAAGRAFSKSDYLIASRLLEAGHDRPSRDSSLSSPPDVPRLSQSSRELNIWVIFNYFSQRLSKDPTRDNKRRPAIVPSQ